MAGASSQIAHAHDQLGRLESIVMVESIRENFDGKTKSETRFYISSLAANARHHGAPFASTAPSRAITG